MWFQIVSEYLSNITAFTLVMHNANVHLTTADFIAAFRPVRSNN